MDVVADIGAIRIEVFKNNGDNQFELIDIQRPLVRELFVTMLGSGAITEITVCKTE